MFMAKFFRKQLSISLTVILLEYLSVIYLFKKFIECLLYARQLLSEGSYSRNDNDKN